jgi:aryl-phospho-beta-D-glucosidase BglC (GH1 family)
VPFSLDMVMNNPNTTGINYYCSTGMCNLDLKGLSTLEILDKVVQYAATKGLLIMFDMHSFEPDAFSRNGLWYDDTHSEQLVLQGWTTLIRRYGSQWNVFAADLKNEPFATTWNTGNAQTDWNQAAQRIGSVIASQTDWLVFVEGTANSPSCDQACFYGTHPTLSPSPSPSQSSLQ